jgi:hypothetical protein
MVLVLVLLLVVDCLMLSVLMHGHKRDRHELQDT